MGKAGHHRPDEAAHGGRPKKLLTRLFRALNEEEDAPYEWMISRVCEEFNVLPSAAIRELENDAEHLVFSILTCRAFARAKELYDRAKTEKEMNGLPKSRIMELVKEIDFDIAREDIARAHRESEDA